MAPINTSEGDTFVAFIEASQLQKMEYGVRHQLAARGLKAKFSLDDIIGKSAALERAKLQTRAFAATDSTVLIYGETGTGKELFAHAMHQLGNRRQHPFIAINCSALPKELIESELFGYEEGAFTGARKKGKQGLFELAHGGTIFLDEIGTLPLDAQTKLLRVIQEKEVIRLGASQIIPVDVRIIAATNRDLEEEVQKGSFREDLFYRLNVLSLQLPPLRERGEDVLLLFNHFFGEFCRRFGFNLAPPESEEQQLLLAYHWPGNIRELRNFTERYVVLGSYSSDTAGLLKKLYAELKRCQHNSQPPKTNNPVLWLEGLQEDKKAGAGKRELPAGNGAIDAQKQQQTPVMGEIIDFLNLTEKEFLGAIGEKFNWRKKAMAAALGVSTTTLWRKLKKTGLAGRHK
jgi:transcriptional regulator with PAS, ATPase and Fis domain